MRINSVYIQSPARSIDFHLYLIHHGLLSPSTRPRCPPHFCSIHLLTQTSILSSSFLPPGSLGCRHTSPPLLVSFPLTLEQMAGPALSVWAWLTGAGHQPLQKTSHMPLCPVSLPSIALSFNSPFPRSPPNLLGFIFLFYLSSTLLPSLWYRYLLVVLIVEMLSTPWYFSTEYRSVLIWSTFARMDPLFSLLFKHKYTDKNNTTIGHG